MTSMYLTVADVRSIPPFHGAFGDEGIDFTGSDYTDAEITSLISSASRSIDAYCKDTVTYTNVTEKYAVRHSRGIKLRHYPLAEFTDIAISHSFAGNSVAYASPLTAQINPNDVSCTVTDGSGFLKKQFLLFDDGSSEAGIELSSVSGNTLHFKKPAVLVHAVGINAWVATIDYIQVSLTGQNVPPGMIVLDTEKGMLTNYGPMMLQGGVYTTKFASVYPLSIRLNYGFRIPAGATSYYDVYPAGITWACEQVIKRIAESKSNIFGIASIHVGQRTQRYDTKSLSIISADPDIVDALRPYNRSSAGFMK